MGKSLRSKSVLRAKSIKRKGEFANIVDKRNERLAQKMAEYTKKQNEAKQTAEGEQDMEVEKGAEVKEKKVSTSGWRNSRKQQYKQKKQKKNQKGQLKF